MRSNCRLCKAFVRVELQFGPFAVAQLRLLAEMQALTKPSSKKASAPEVNLFITNTLDNPFVEEEQLQNIVEAVARGEPGKAEPADYRRDRQSTLQEPSWIRIVKDKGNESWRSRGHAGADSCLKRHSPKLFLHSATAKAKLTNPAITRRARGSAPQCGAIAASAKRLFGLNCIHLPSRNYACLQRCKH